MVSGIHKLKLNSKDNIISIIEILMYNLTACIYNICIVTVKYETYTTAPKINKIYRIYFSFLENAPTPKKEKANFSKKGMVLSLTKKNYNDPFFFFENMFFFQTNK